MLGSLFKPGWRSSSAEKRMQAVQDMDARSPENQAIFLKLANTDEETSIRHQALRKLRDPKAIYKISCDHSDAETRSVASSKLHHLIGSKSLFTIDEFRVLLKELPDIAEQIALSCPHKELRTEHIETLSESRQLELLSEIDYSETRKQIVENLESMTSLEAARKVLKGRDKTAEKIIKSKLDLLRAEQRLIEENRFQAQQLVEKIEYLASHDWQPDFKARFSVCQQQWNDLKLTPDGALVEKFESLSKDLKEEVESRIRSEEAYREQASLALRLEQCAFNISGLSEDELKADTGLKKELSKSLSSWAELQEVVRPNLNIADQFLNARRAIESVLNYLIDAESELDGKQEVSTSTLSPQAEIDSDPVVSEKLELEQDESPKPETIPDGIENIQRKQDQYKKDSARQIKQLSKMLKQLYWPQNYPDLLLKDALESRLTDLKEQFGQTQKEVKEQLDRLHKKISSIQGLASRGHIGRAKRELESAVSSAEKYQGRDRAALDERIQKASEAVSKMGDWKDFAIEPKYVELCEQMERLIGSELHADMLAQEISKLQANWKSLGYSDSSENYWPRFKEAGDKAYEPCATFFKERHENRRLNLQSREPFIEQMQSILVKTDWDNQSGSEQPDYKKIEQDIRSISNDWKKIKDIEQGPGQKQWKRFSAIRSDVYAKMDIIYDANIALKKTLIEQAKILMDAEVREETFNSLQQIQTRWKQVGITRRKDDQSAWTEFKTLTDSLYEKIRSLRNEKKAEEDAQINAYRDIIQKIRTLAKNAKDLAESDPVFDQLESDYRALPELPKQFSEKLMEGLEKDLQRAKEEYSNARGRILSTVRNKEINALSKRAEICSLLEKLPANAPDDEIDALLAAIEEQPLTDKQLTERFQQRLDTARQPDFDREEANRARRILCIDMEILMERESPQEDKELRMSLQFERMKSQGIGRSQISKEQQLDEYKLNWLCLPGAEPELQDKLDKRFSALINK